MTRFRTAGVLWLVAAVLSAAATLVFRDDAWYAVTLVASLVAALVGILLIWRSTPTTVLVSTILGVVWVVVYVILVVDQFDDVQAWTADAFFGLVGGAAAFIAYRAKRQSVE